MLRRALRVLQPYLSPPHALTHVYKHATGPHTYTHAHTENMHMHTYTFSHPTLSKYGPRVRYREMGSGYRRVTNNRA